ncbi:MAG: phytanoyl-CoA dioxygenase family protein [Actinomycetota bacterium]|nr:phytanoyl-CoA dioxygenase family protein [Acidimicrobiales bacterium]
MKLEGNRMLAIAQADYTSNAFQEFRNGIPLICGPGDAFIINRQTLHGSYANTSKDRRVMMNFRFYRYSSVIGIEENLSGAGNYCDEKYV